MECQEQNLRILLERLRTGSPKPQLDMVLVCKRVASSAAPKCLAPQRCEGEPQLGIVGHCLVKRLRDAGSLRHISHLSTADKHVETLHDFVPSQWTNLKLA
eukprot:861543-Amphidinium_carterae.1